MRFVRFLPKTIIIYFEKKTRFDCKNYYGNNKLANI